MGFQVTDSRREILAGIFNEKHLVTPVNAFVQQV